MEAQVWIAKKIKHSKILTPELMDGGVIWNLIMLWREMILMEQNIKKGKRKKNREEEEDENFRKYTGRRFFHLEAESDNLDFKLQMLFIVCCVKCFNETFSTHLLPCNCNPIFYYFFYQYCILLLLLYYYIPTTLLHILLCTF